jgi:hypothetical protein
MAILENAAVCLKTYDSRCLHYNIIANAVYGARERVRSIITGV